MVKSVEIGDDGLVDVGVYLTVAGCPMRDAITSRVTGAVAPLPGVTGVRVDLDVMSEEQRQAHADQGPRRQRRAGDPVRPAVLADHGVRGGRAARAASASRRSP